APRVREEIEVDDLLTRSSGANSSAQTPIWSPQTSALWPFPKLMTSTTRFVAGSICCTIASQQPSTGLRPASISPVTQMLPIPTAIPPPPTSQPGSDSAGMRVTGVPVVGSIPSTSPLNDPSCLGALTQTAPSPTAIAFGKSAMSIVSVTRASTESGDEDMVGSGVDRGSGYQAGENSSPGASFRGSASDPSQPITYRSRCSAIWTANAISSPSGDHTGSMALAQEGRHE